MTKVCLECATPRFLAKVEKGLQYCDSCKRQTHTIEGEARRPLCHDCKHFSIKCRDGIFRPALDYGPDYLEQATCMGGKAESTLHQIQIGAVRTIVPFVAKYFDDCGAFVQHRNAPKDGRPNPLTLQQRKDWREYLEMPTAFWLDPRRWDGVIDAHKQMFWDRKPKQGGGAAILGLGAIAVGLFAKKVLVDSKKTGAKQD